MRIRRTFDILQFFFLKNKSISTSMARSSQLRKKQQRLRKKRCCTMSHYSHRPANNTSISHKTQNLQQGNFPKIYRLCHRRVVTTLYAYEEYDEDSDDDNDIIGKEPSSCTDASSNLKFFTTTDDVVLDNFYVTESELESFLLYK